MTIQPTLYSNKASEAEITAHLTACDTTFVPYLSTRVQLNQYAHKIYINALRLEAWIHDSLIGLLAVYCNDPDQRFAYITSVSVLPAWRRKRVASLLLAECVRYLRNRAFEYVELEVGIENLNAVHMYERHGFIPCYQANGSV